MRPQAPYLSRDYAREAAGTYERALASAGDPGLLAGMAAGLDMSGDQRGALAALRGAVTLAPDSPEALLALAAEQEKSGAFRDAQQTAERVLSMSGGADPLMRDVRYVKVESVAGERGYLGYSVGADRLAVPGPSSARGCGAGGFAVLSDPIPATDDPLVEDRTRWDPLADAALSLSLAAATVLSDSASPATDLDRWERLLAGGPKSSLNNAWRERTATLEADALAPRLVAGQLDQASLDRVLVDPTLGSPFTLSFRFAESQLRHAGAAAHQPALFARAAAVCHAAIANDVVRPEAEQCEAESTYYAGDPVKAAGLLRAIGGDEATTLIEEAFATWRGGDPKQADQLFQTAIEDRRAETANVALADLLDGELLLDQAQPGVAIRYVEKALRAVQADSAHEPAPSPAERAIVEHAKNERGLALLWSAQREPNTPPDCGRRRAVCEAARDDFLDALTIDPSDPLALQNLGWAERLLGDLVAARRSLAEAVSSDPADYPALNDLGWLAAGVGDLQAARSALEEALTLRPDDDIAAWNLGIVLLQSGPAGIPQGEAYLARAIRENPALREHPLGYLTDERIYRRFYGAAIEPVSTAPLDERVGGGALATGVVGAAGALLAVSGVEMEHRLEEVLAGRELPLVGALLARLRRRRDGARPAGPRRRALWSGLRWGITGITLAGVAIWTAWPISSPARGSILALALGATALALLVHESAQVVAAHLASVRFRPVWPQKAIALSLALLPFGVADGPFPGHAAAPATPFRRARWVYAAGIIANLAAAALFYGLYRAQPLPALRLLAEFQLAAAAFSLVPLRPLDPSAFQPHRFEALLLVPLALFAAVAGYAFRSGMV